jgi:hypothetical protein
MSSEAPGTLVNLPRIVAEQAALAITVAGLCACSTVAGFHPYVPEVPPSRPQLVADLAKVRGVPLNAPVPIQELPEADFLARARQSTPRGRSTTSPGFFEAFSMGSMAQVGRGADAIYDAELGGFYDPATKELFVRWQEKPDMTQRMIVDHEAEHALQDRTFGLPPLAGLDLNEFFAVRALYEGDATVAATLVESRRAGVAANVALAELAAMPERTRLDEMLAKDPAAAREAPPLVREALLRPYMGGTSFVARLAASGGWPLVNAVFGHPPRTTEQVLHVEKYLAGEPPIPVTLPRPPEGYARQSAGTMGELATSVLLAQCSRDAVAKEGARGWGGDAFTVVTKGDTSGLLWITAWDDSLSAARFARAIEDRRACQRTGAKPAFVSVREGNRVAFVQGLESEEARRHQADFCSRGRTRSHAPFKSAIGRTRSSSSRRRVLGWRRCCCSPGGFPRPKAMTSRCGGCTASRSPTILLRVAP